MRRRGDIWACALLLPVVLGISCLTTEAKAASEYDGLLHKTSSLYVYTDGPAQTQTMDISGTWWSDFKQAYQKRLDQGLAWPSNFVPQFESFMASGSWGVVMEESPDGITVSLFGTADPNAHCDFTEPTVATPTPMFGCISHAGYDYATASYFTHKSYGGNGCVAFSPIFTPDFCSDNGMGVYDSPTVGHVMTEDRFWLRSAPDSLRLYIMNFDIHYPDGYAGELIGTKPVSPPTSSPEPTSDPPPTVICGVTPGILCDTAVSTHPCDRRHRDFGDALVSAWTCAAIQTVNFAKCGFSVATIIVKPLKLVKVKLTKKGLVNLRTVRPSWRPIARIYNVLAKSRFSHRAPKGFRTPAEVVEKMSKVKRASDFLNLLPKIQQAISAADFFALTKQVAKIAGLESCVDGVLLAAQE